MDELLLIEMMSMLNPELLQNDFIEKDMKRGKIPFFNRLFSFTKAPKQRYENFFEYSQSEDSTNQNIRHSDELAESRESEKLEVNDNHDLIESMEESEKIEDYNLNNFGFSISIFKRKFRNLVKIISGIVAAFFVVIGIIVIIIRHHRGGIKLYEKKVQVIY